MIDRTHGYDTSMAYTYGFYREMAPDWLDLCAALAGQAPPRKPGKPLRYLDLGAGQGMGLCLLAAANPDGEFVGVDFLPDHVAHATQVAEAAGLTNLRFSGADFLDLAKDWPEDFGTFDYVVLHGIYSWVAPHVRAALVECLRKATHPGSLVYLSYNTQPGWLATIPFQHISRLVQQVSGNPAEAVFAESIGIFDRLQAGGAATFQFLPGLKSRLEQVKRRSANYLVQEYLNEDWQPLWHSEVAAELAGAGLAHAGTATAAEALMPGQLPPQLQSVITGQADSRLRQDLQDFVLNQSFRRDIFVRGEAGGGPDFAALGKQRVCLRPPPPAAGKSVEVKTAFGEIELQPPAYAAIVEALKGGPRSIAELAGLPEQKQAGLEGTALVVLMLLHQGTLTVEPAVQAPGEAAHRLNRFVAAETARGVHYEYLAAPRFSSAVRVADLQLLFLDAWFAADGKADAAALAAGAGARMEALGRQLHHAQGVLEGAQRSQMLTVAANEFLGEIVPRWRQFGALP